MGQFKPALIMLLSLTLVTGVVYPLVVTVIGQGAFTDRANGSLIVADGGVVGSELIGQSMTDPAYFWPRPSASEYGAVPSGATNWGPTSAALAEAVADRAEFLREETVRSADAPLPPELLFASGSGLDPHISPEAARLQIDRVASARHMDEAQRDRLEALVEQVIEPPQFGVLGEPRVNVLLLNRALDEMS